MLLFHSGRLSSGAYLPQEWFALFNGLVALYTNIPQSNETPCDKAGEGKSTGRCLSHDS